MQNKLTVIRDQTQDEGDPEPSTPPVIEVIEPGDSPEAPRFPVVDSSVTLLYILRELRNLKKELIDNPGTPRVLVEQLITTSDSYVSVLVWTIPPDRVGQLHEISIRSDTPATAQFRVTIAGVVQFQDALIAVPLTSPFPTNNRLDGEQTVEIDVLSDGTISIIADVTITGIELEP